MLDYIITNVEVMDRLSYNEREFIAKLNDLNNSHFENAIYSRLQEELRDLVLTADNDRYTHAKPQINEFVFCRAPHDVESVEVNVGSFTELTAGVVHVMPYRAVQSLVLTDDVHLI